MIQGLAVAPARQLVGFLKRHDGIGAGGHGGAGHNADGAAGGNGGVRHLAGGDGGGDGQRGRRRVGGGNVGAAHGIAVHRRVGQRRQVQRGGYLLGQRQAQGLQDGQLHGVQRRKVSDDTRKGILYFQQIFVGVGIMVSTVVPAVMAAVARAVAVVMDAFVVAVAVGIVGVERAVGGVGGGRGSGHNGKVLGRWFGTLSYHKRGASWG